MHCYRYMFHFCCRQKKSKHKAKHEVVIIFILQYIYDIFVLVKCHLQNILLITLKKKDYLKPKHSLNHDMFGLKKIKSRKTKKKGLINSKFK